MNGSGLASLSYLASWFLLLASLFVIYEIVCYVLKHPRQKRANWLPNLRAAAMRIFQGHTDDSTTRRGMGRILGVVFCGVLGAAAFVGYTMRSSEVQANVIDTYYNALVVSNPDGAYRYWIKPHSASGEALPLTYLNFCHDFEPEFSPGQTLLILKVEHKWGCVSVANTHPGYRIKRDDRPNETAN